MPDRTQRQVQRIDKHGRSRPIEYRAIDVSGDGGVEPGEPKPNERREKPEEQALSTANQCKVIAVTRILTGYRRERDPRRRRL